MIKINEIDEKGLFKYLNKAIGFRLSVLKKFKGHGITPPTDEQISQYICEGYGFNPNDLYRDFMEHEGIFRTEFDDFVKEVNKITFAVVPTIEELQIFFNAHGNDVSGFCSERTLNSMGSFEKELLNNLEAFGEIHMVGLWNAFIESTLLYGKDSYIYNLNYIPDFEEFVSLVGDEAKANELVENGVKLVQYHYNETIHVIKSIKNTLIAFWSEIVEDIENTPSAYYGVAIGSSKFDFIEEVFIPICLKYYKYK